MHPCLCNTNKICILTLTVYMHMSIHGMYISFETLHQDKTTRFYLLNFEPVVGNTVGTSFLLLALGNVKRFFFIFMCVGAKCCDNKR